MSAIVDGAEGAMSVTGATPRLKVETSEWSYLAEGGFHVILRYDGTSPVLMGRILRIGKESLGHVKEADDDAAQDAPVVTDEAGARRKFERAVLMPLLGDQYVQPGDAVTLTTEDIDKIHASIYHLRPEGRIKKDKGVWSTAAQLEPDKTAFWLPVPSATGSQGAAASSAAGAPKASSSAVVIAVEVKPKGAVMPIGTLIPPGNNRLKYRVVRFDAQQRFKAQGKQSWGTIDRPCEYHPMEFYSGDAGRAAATLKELMKTPQNKFRCWENGNMLFGAGSGQASDEDAESEEQAMGEEKLSRAVENAGLAGGDGTSAEGLMDLIGEILEKEPLVSQLVNAQALDVLEVEGGGIVFDKLVSLCGDSKETALTLLEDGESDPFTAEPPHPDLLVPEDTLKALREGSSTPEGEDGIDALYEKGLKAVETLSVEDCVQLLRRYIIGLGVMDCSIMMSLKAVSREGKDATLGVTSPTSSVQDRNMAGVFETRDGRGVAYCVSVVDAGPKPPTKLSGKAKHESKIWDFVAELEAKGDSV